MSHSFCTMLVVISLVSVAVALQPWTHNQRETRALPQTDIKKMSSCETTCSTTQDCPPGLSCFEATSNSKGCCLRALKPNESGCVIDEQCKRACESTHCDTTQTPSRCLCDADRHFLFNKCWKKCPEFAHSEPVMDPTGFSQCILKVDSKTAASYMRRFRRQMRSNFC